MTLGKSVWTLLLSVELEGLPCAILYTWTYFEIK